MRFLKDSYHKTKHHHKNILLLSLTLLITPLLVFGIYSLFPPKVNAAPVEPNQAMDASFSAEVWGVLDQKSVSVEITPKVALTTNLKPSRFPLKTLVEFEPTELLAPNTTYKLEFSIENWSGLKSKKTLIRTTTTAPKILKVSPSIGAVDLNSKTTLDFQLSDSLNKGSFELQTEPAAKFSITHK